MLTEAERKVGRALAALSRPGAWLEENAHGYLVRGSTDRRRRPALRLDEAAFRLLADSPGLKPREAGGYVLVRRARPAAPAAEPGRPGFIAGLKTVTRDGVRIRAAANLGESPIAWLARRKDADGAPFLTRAQLAAAEKLAADHEAAGQIGRLTMQWDTMPKSASRTPGLDPMERGEAARRRLRAALDAAGPGLAEIAEQVCLRGLSLEQAEKALGLPRRSGKAFLRLALDRVAAHLRIG